MVVISIIGAVVALAAVILILAARKPDDFVIARSATIGAPASRVFSLINDFRAWSLWSPWEKLDPQMNRTHSGSSSGVGAVYEWDGNKKVGKGRMEIVEAEADSKIALDLRFTAPWEARNLTEFRLESSGSDTTITWSMRGTNPFMMKVMGMFMNMDAMIGKDFEAGLANLKAAAERG